MAEGTTFWEHVEVFRWMIIRCVTVLLGIAVLAFCYKEFVFDRLILAPCDDDFLTYRLLRSMGMPVSPSEIEMINIELASQLMVHLRVSLYLALVVAFPYLIVELWLFVKPALYSNERRPAVTAIVAFFLQFFLGMALAFTLSLLTYYVHGVFNNFLDTDKLSVPFWAFTAAVVALDLHSEKKEAK